MNIRTIAVAFVVVLILTILSIPLATSTLLIDATNPTSAIYLPLISNSGPTATRTLTPTITRTPTPTPTPTSIPMPGYNMHCQHAGTVEICASVSNANPISNSTEIVYGRLIINGAAQASQSMTATWNYKTTTSYCVGMTGIDGIAQCDRSIGTAASGYTVSIDVSIEGYLASTSFTPP